jgi:hypothetical protein
LIRRVAFSKAVIAGIAGALGWELLARLLILYGLPLLDLVYVLGTMVFSRTPAYPWWFAGVALHSLVGAIWAIFYAYFFWSTLDLSPWLQGMLFSLGPAILAGLVMVPQMDLMNPLIIDGELRRMGMFGLGLGWGGPVLIFSGHLLYGAVMGSIYTKPVGYRTGAKGWSSDG